MLSKLAFRNMKRSARDYLVYLLTMSLISALMYTFNSLLFQNEAGKYYDAEDMLEVLVVLATVFIVWITAWLIGYMVRFMMGKRSREFGIYLLLGMKKGTIAKLYLQENILLGSFSLLLGMGFGILLQQILMAILFSMLRMTYHLHIALHPGTVIMTLLCYGCCFIVSLFRCRRKFKKMNIHDLLEAERRNEQIGEKHETLKQFLMPLSILFLFLFWALFGVLSHDIQICLFLIGLVLTIYLFYIGLSARIICYIRKGGKRIYKGQNLFLLRQFSGKIRTMQFTLGTLTALFTLALMGSSIALMFSAWQNSLLEYKFPFDILLYSPDPADDFQDEIQFLEKRTEIQDLFPYRIYTDGGNRVNAWMLTHLQAWGTMFQNPDGTPDMDKIRQKLENESVYCTYDTYMGLSDYNTLRAMLGYEEINLSDTEYALQIKLRLEKEVRSVGDDLKLADADGSLSLSCGGIYTDPFSQDGHNGGDYLVVVPDQVLARMYPYYAELALDINGPAPLTLREELNELRYDKINDTMIGGTDISPALKGNRCYGSDTILVFNAVNEVRENLRSSLTYMLAALMIPLFYIGLVFLCVAVTVLSVQQLSDSARCRYHYDILSRLGVKESGIHRLILRQLAACYLCPALLAVLISGKMMLFAGKLFVFATGVPVAPGSFFLKSTALFFGIYLVYFAVTFISFCRNVSR